MTVQVPPDITPIQTNVEKLTKIFRHANQADFQEAVRKANERYLHWDEIMHRPMPEGITAEELWTYLKITRRPLTKYVPLLDKKGKKFSYAIQDAMLKALNEVDVWSGRSILTNHPGLPSEPQYIINSLMEEAIASSQLEGAATTRKVAKEMLRSGRKPKDESEQMVLNNWHTMQHILRNRNFKLDAEKFCEIQAMITKSTLKEPRDSGQFRTVDDVVVVDPQGEVVHVPPKAASLQERIEALCRFANDESEHSWIHPALKAAMLHFWVGYDHPFADGNGRTARALLYWYMLKHGYYLFQYLSISRYFLEAPAKYGQAYLYTETDEGDLTYFLMHNLDVICKSLQALQEYIQRKQSENELAAQLLRKYKGLNYRQRALIYHAIRHPEYVYTIQSQKTTHGSSYETSRKDLLGLSKKGLLVRKLEGKEFVFFAVENLAEKLRVEQFI